MTKNKTTQNTEKGKEKEKERGKLRNYPPHNCLKKNQTGFE